MYAAGTVASRATTVMSLACLMENLADLEKYPVFFSMDFSTPAAYFANLSPTFGQKTTLGTVIIIEGMKVREPRRATRTPPPTAKPIPFKKGTPEKRPRNTNEIITVRPLVAMLSPAQVTDLVTARTLSLPLTLSSLYLASRKTE